MVPSESQKPIHAACIIDDLTRGELPIASRRSAVLGRRQLFLGKLAGRLLKRNSQRSRRPGPLLNPGSRN